MYYNICMKNIILPCLLISVLFLTWCEKDRISEWVYTEKQCINAGGTIGRKSKIDDDVNDSWFAQKLASWNVNFSITCNEETQKIIWKIIYDEPTIDGGVCCK